MALKIELEKATMKVHKFNIRKECVDHVLFTGYLLRVDGIVRGIICKSNNYYEPTESLDDEPSLPEVTELLCRVATDMVQSDTGLRLFNKFDDVIVKNHRFNGWNK